jgi:hypothetical protein
METKTKTMNWMQRARAWVKHNALKVVTGVTVAATSVSSAYADTSAPLDLTSTGTTIAGYIATAAGAGVAVLAGLYGVRVIIRAFKSVK